MDMNQEIRRIAEYQNSILPRHEKKSEQAISGIVSNAIAAYEHSCYDFTKYQTFKLKQVNKIREVKMYPLFSPEELICIYLKRSLDRKFHVTYPNRNSFMRSLFNTTYALKNMSDYTIVKFDFRDFFNSISSAYVYKKYMQNKNLERYQANLLEEFVSTTKYAYAGLNTSNIICEIAALQFDSLVSQKLSTYGIILYKRYIDDGIIIFNSYINQSECLNILQQSIEEVFYDSQVVAPKCKTALNTAKTKYIARRNLSVGGAHQEFDFLGYQFELWLESNNKTETTKFMYGITQQKIDKYSKRISNIVEEYARSSDRNMELLRHQIKAFTHRTVYQVNRYKTVIWKSKGFLSNYCELRFRMDALTPSTEHFLKTAVIKAFSQNSIALPYFLRSNQQESIYSLFNNFKNNSTLLFVELIGIDKKTLCKMCRQIGINIDSSKTYDGLVRDYLIAVKVGH